MNLAQMFASANGKSGYARSEGEIYAALSRAGFKVYSAVLKEFRGFFLKFDETSLSLSPANATQEYAMPADFTQMVHLAERQTTSENWHPMSPIDLDDAVSDLQDSLGWGPFYSSAYGDGSPFGFYGPYLDAAAAVQGQALQIQKIRVAPITDVTRMVQIAYTAKWLPIVDANSSVMLPDEGTMAMESFASAELCGMSDDTRASFYEKQGDNDLQAFLWWSRARQIMQPPTIREYGP